MKLLLTTALAAMFCISASAPTFADGKNWSEEKAAQIEINRNTNSGKGNGGEGGDDGSFDKPNEVGSNGNNPDLDPGKSGAQCQGGKNDENNGDSC